MTPFEQALRFTLGVEGRFSNDSRDSGGRTNWGITEATARAHGYTGPMEQLPLDTAVGIYRKDYWDALQLDRVAEIDPDVAMELFDTAVNCGTAVPVRFLQRALNVFNRQETDFSDLTVDGAIGTRTVDALRAFLTRRGNLGSQVISEMLNALQAVYYVELAERRPKDEAFMFGWIANRVLRRAA